MCSKSSNDFSSLSESSPKSSFWSTESYIIYHHLAAALNLPLFYKLTQIQPLFLRTFPPQVFAAPLLGILFPQIATLSHTQTGICSNIFPHRDPPNQNILLLCNCFTFHLLQMELSHGNYSFAIANLHISKLSPITMATISKIWLIKHLHIPLIFTTYRKQSFEAWLFSQYRDINWEIWQWQLIFKTTKKRCHKNPSWCKIHTVYQASQDLQCYLKLSPLPFGSAPDSYYHQRVYPKKPSPTSRSSHVLFLWFETLFTPVQSTTSLNG